MAAVEAAKDSFNELVTTIQDYTATHLPKRQAQGLVERAAQDFEPFYQSQRAASATEVKATSGILALTTDGKGVSFSI